MLSRPDVLTAVVFFEKLAQRRQGLFELESARVYKLSFFFIKKPKKENEEVISNIKSISVKERFCQDYPGGELKNEFVYEYFKNNRA